MNWFVTENMRWVMAKDQQKIYKWIVETRKTEGRIAGETKEVMNTLNVTPTTRFSKTTLWRGDHNLSFKRESIMESWTAAEPNNFYFGANVIMINQPRFKYLIPHNQTPTYNFLLFFLVKIYIHPYNFIKFLILSLQLIFMKLGPHTLYIL